MSRTSADASDSRRISVDRLSLHRQTVWSRLDYLDAAYRLGEQVPESGVWLPFVAGLGKRHRAAAALVGSDLDALVAREEEQFRARPDHIITDWIFTLRWQSARRVIDRLRGLRARNRREGRLCAKREAQDVEPRRLEGWREVEDNAFQCLPEHLVRLTHIILGEGHILAATAIGYEGHVGLAALVKGHLVVWPGDGGAGALLCLRRDQQADRRIVEPLGRCERCLPRWWSASAAGSARR